MQTNLDSLFLIVEQVREPFFFSLTNTGYYRPQTKKLSTFSILVNKTLFKYVDKYYYSFFKNNNYATPGSAYISSIGRFCVKRENKDMLQWWLDLKITNFKHVQYGNLRFEGMVHGMKEIAIIWNKVDMFKFLYERYPANFDTYNFNNSYVSFALHDNRVEIVQYLMDKGVTITVPDYIPEFCNDELREFLIEKGLI